MNFQRVGYQVYESQKINLRSGIPDLTWGCYRQLDASVTAEGRLLIEAASISYRLDPVTCCRFAYLIIDCFTRWKGTRPTSAGQRSRSEVSVSMRSVCLWSNSIRVHISRPRPGCFFRRRSLYSIFGSNSAACFEIRVLAALAFPLDAGLKLSTAAIYPIHTPTLPWGLIRFLQLRQCAFERYSFRLEKSSGRAS